jgi:hypothetical protein
MYLSVIKLEFFGCTLVSCFLTVIKNEVYILMLLIELNRFLFLVCILHSTSILK